MKFASKPVLWLVLGIALIGALALSGAWFLRGQAQVEPPVVEEGSAPLGPEATGTHTCTITEVAAFTNRIHVRCNTAPAAHNTVYFFSASSLPADIQNTNRYLTLLNTALALGKPVHLYYDTLSSANPAGCNTNDCRKIVGLYVKP